MRQTKTSLLILIFTILFASKTVFAQNELGVYFCGVTMHLLGDKNAALMPLKLDEKALFVVNVGGAIQYRKYFYKRFSVDVEQTFQADCAFKASLGTGISIGYDFIKSPKHQLIFALGPGIFFRKSWFVLDGYIPVEELNVSANKKWEYLFVPVVPHFEYAIVPENNKFGISCYCVFDPINVLANVGFGLTYKID